MFRFLLNPVRNLLSRYRRDGDSRLKRLISNGINILFPPLCLGCQAYLSYKSNKTNKSNRSNRSNWPICNNCFKTIPINSGFYCPLCSRRLPEPKKSCHPETKYILAAVSSYQNPVLKELIHSFKYQNMKSAIEPIETLINFYLEKTIRNWKLEISNSLIIPIPLHPRKERQRGFNQAELIAKIVQRYINLTPISPISPISPFSSINPINLISPMILMLPIITNVLIRTKNTPSQTELKSQEEKKQNIAGAFQIKYPEKIKGKNIILVDDVFTSGATMNEAVQVLKSAGAKKIIAFVIAKT